MKHFITFAVAAFAYSFAKEVYGQSGILWAMLIGGASGIVVELIFILIEKILGKNKKTENETDETEEES